ncbi:hypothetical protein BJV78DRAFT_1254896 [Lactifluus subvellereus]|nr:hypothetical protein BJV78DRAFT_1255297 [Lactifluus subvellereus]KAI0246417.1 hypothetical protein BJV78DRAFT_1254896 [Lactifluus subvellereus]
MTGPYLCLLTMIRGARTFVVGRCHVQVVKLICLGGITEGCPEQLSSQKRSLMLCSLLQEGIWTFRHALAEMTEAQVYV